jgi:hypothetical protein
MNRAVAKHTAETAELRNLATDPAQSEQRRWMAQAEGEDKNCGKTADKVRKALNHLQSKMIFKVASSVLDTSIPAAATALPVTLFWRSRRPLKRRAMFPPQRPRPRRACPFNDSRTWSMSCSGRRERDCLNCHSGAGL